MEVTLRRRRIVLLGAAGILAAVVVGACGGSSSGGDEDPQQVLDETFTGTNEVTSGVFELTLGASGQIGGQDGSFDASVGGPFQEQAEGELPAFDLSFDLNLESPQQDAAFAGALTSTGAAGFVTFMGTTYEVDGEIFDALKQGFEDGAATDTGSTEDPAAQLDALGIDPRGWLTNLQNEGNEDVEGTETIHISGEANVPQIVEDIQSAASAAGDQVPAVPTDQLSQIEDSVKEARIDIFTGAEDKILRRLAFTFEIDVPEDAADGGGNASIDFSVTLSQLNEEQTIEAPTGALPLSELLGQFGLLGLGDLGALGDLGIGAASGDSAPSDSSPAPAIPEITEDIPEIDPGAVPDLPEEAQQYLACINAAQSPADLEDCAPLIPS